MSEHAGERERGRGKNIVWVEGRETREGNKRGMGRTEGGMGRTEGGKKGGRVEERRERTLYGWKERKQERKTREGNKVGMGRTEGGKKGGRVEERKLGKREEVGQDDIR